MKMRNSLVPVITRKNSFAPMMGILALLKRKSSLALLLESLGTMRKIKQIRIKKKSKTLAQMTWMTLSPEKVRRKDILRKQSLLDTVQMMNISQKKSLSFLVKK